MQENEQGEKHQSVQAGPYDIMSSAQTAQAEQIEKLRSLWVSKEHVALFGDYNFVVLSETELSPAMNVFSDLIWSEEQDCDVDRALTAAELAGQAQLEERIAGAFHLSIGIFERDRFIGWCWGRQESSEEFHMVVSALPPEYQSRGIYTALLPEIINMLQAEGFQSIYSWHQPNNPGILIPKLKAGFVISGFRVWDRFGLLVQLTYFFNETRRELFSYRIGRARLSDRIAPLFT